MLTPALWPVAHPIHQSLFFQLYQHAALLVFEMLHLGLDGERRSSKHGGRKHSGTDAGQSTRTRTSATEGPLAVAEVCDAYSGSVAGRCRGSHADERLERMGRRKNRASYRRR